MSYWAMMDLDASIPSEERLSGASVLAAIGGEPCHVLFPRLPIQRSVVIDFDGGSVEFPRVRPPDESAIWSDSYSSPETWGSYRSAAQGVTLSPHCIGLRFDNLTAPDVDWAAFYGGDQDESAGVWEFYERLRPIRTASRQWRTRMLDWLAILHLEVPTTSSIDEPLYWIEPGPDISGGPTYTYEPTNPVLVDTWRHAILHASNGNDAPLAPALLMQGIRAFTEGDYRRAVIDAASACELALYEAMTRLLDKANESNPGIADVILRRPDTLGRRLDVAVQIGVKVEPALRKMVELRNAVAHKGMTPDSDGARTALRAVVEFVNEYAPVETFVVDHCTGHELPDVLITGE